MEDDEFKSDIDETPEYVGEAEVSELTKEMEKAVRDQFADTSEEVIINSYEALFDKVKEYLKVHHLKEVQSLQPMSTFTLPIENSEIEELFSDAPDVFSVLVKNAIIDLLTEYPYSQNPDLTRKEYEELRVFFTTHKTQKMSEIKSTMVNSPVAFNAVITGMDERKLYISKAYMICPNAHDVSKGLHDVTLKREIPFIRCAECNAEMELVTEKSIFQYIQRIVLQQPLEETRTGTQLEQDGIIIGDLVGDVSVGEKKQCVGIFRAIINEKRNEHRIIFDLISAINLDVHKELLPTSDELEMLKDMSKKSDYFEKLAESYAPEVIGGSRTIAIKKTILLALAGGVKTSKKRGNINILLLGDPSVAKSSLLKFGSIITPKSLYTTGKGSSAAGLTIGMVKRPDGTMIAQAGVLPLCHNGVAFIDELDKMNPVDRSGLHEAMEQQSVGIAKSGNIVRLPAAASVLAAANPKGGKYDQEMRVVDNVNLSVTLLSRFDIKWLMLDIVNLDLDTKIADGIMDEFDHKTTSPISSDLLMKLLTYVKPMQPKLTEEARYELKKIYNKLRKFSTSETQAIIDPRQLESLIRLVMAYAKIHFKEQVDRQDVLDIENLYAESLSSFGFNLATGEVHQETFSATTHTSKEKEFFNAVKECESKKDGWFKKIDVINKLKSSKYYQDEYAVGEMIDKLRHKHNKLIYNQATDMYKRVLDG